MKTRFVWLLLASSVFLISACGQKGPLYLPEQPKSAEKPQVDEESAMPEKVEQGGSITRDIVN